MQDSRQLQYIEAYPTPSETKIGQVKFPAIFIAGLIIAWLSAQTPFIHTARFLLTSTSSLIIGGMLGLSIILFSRGLQWLYIIMFIVFLEQIYIVGASFVDEMILLFLLPKLFTKKFDAGRLRIVLPLTGFILFASISAFYNNVPINVLFAGLRSYVQYVLVFLLLAQSHIGKNDTDKLINTMLMSGIFFSMVGLYSLFKGEVSIVGRAEGVLSNSNALAGYLLFVLPFLWLHYSERDFLPWINKIKFHWISLAVIPAFLATGSRSMITGFGASLSIVILFKFGDFKSKIKTVVFIGMLCIAAVHLSEGKILSRFMQLKSKTYMSYKTNIRTYYALGGWKLFRKNPLLGVGPGRYGGSVATVIYPSPVYRKYRIKPPYEWVKIRQTDMFYPHLIAELGALGSIFYVWLVTMPIILWMKGLLFGSIRWSPMAAACFVSLCGILIANFGGMYFELKLTSLFYFIFLFFLQNEIVQNKK